ncbi:metallophosphoesterase family protein [Sediminibacterium ginsengisoli]|nr:metallophosphoesterase family protein [Sediminibacterium ginsengisoli]
MMKIGLISDTHSFLDEAVFSHFSDCDEIWHAGDFGDMQVADALRAFKPLRGVYGNIDDREIRNEYPELLEWKCEAVSVMMLHIGGYPPRYNTQAKKLIRERKPQLFISGHSHILRVMYDPAVECLYMNPGAAGRQGWHTMRTLIRFVIDGKDIRDCRIIELGRR